jgi:ubiquinone biosynthesis protein COQ9
MTDEQALQDPKAQLLAAALTHVPFDGWSAATLAAAARDAGVSAALARALFPRGGVDLALAFHRQGDTAMVDRLRNADLSAMRFRDRIAHAVRARIEVIPDKELVRRGSTLFALPPHAIDGARALWGTSDAIWTALGDTSRDLNWYTKRATLSAVYASTVLYWLGDDSTGHQATWDFLDRRIEDVMRIEKAKAAVRDNPLAKAVLAGPLRFMEKMRMPKMPDMPDDLPGRMRP